VLYLESARLLDDEEHGVLTVPTPGRGLVFDAGGKNTDSNPASTSAASGPETGAAGDTRFTWNDRLRFERVTGDLELLGDASLEHLPKGSVEKMTMRSASLTARLDQSRGGGGKLLSAAAHGGALAESGTQILAADEFAYDALSDVLTATSTSDVPVSLNDTRRAAPVLAKKLRWDRRSGRIEVLEMMPTTGPLTK
jgi:hypothetical protein